MDTPSFLAAASPFDDDASRWQAVQERDFLADGFFVYGVKTTKIYCRPVCKARLARRANVRFFATGLQAHRAGFRACKRCKPELDGFMPEERAVRLVRAFVASHPVDAQPSPSLGDMAARCGMSRWHFHRVFRKCVGVTPYEFLRARRPASGSTDGLPREQADLAGDGFGRLDGFFDDMFAAEALTLTNPDGGRDGSESLFLDDFLVWPDDDDE
ncbi:hypothetical protein CDD83_4796 [Cordyceps sp. RAO-2017]|nr:hypothetical protein CDD83_4796 [Cordyceps sp. RAO-2017]